MDAGAIALDIMDSLRACLCEELGTDDPTCFCGLYPGSLAVADWCSCTSSRQGLQGCGMAWVRLARVFPTTSFPQIAQGALNCPPTIAAVIELGVYRCVPVPDEKGNPPDAAAQANTVIRQLDDMAAMHRALTCCAALTERPHMFGTYDPRDGGGCGGGIWPATVALVRR